MQSPLLQTGVLRPPATPGLSVDIFPLHPHKHNNISSTYSLLSIQECFWFLWESCKKNNPLLADTDLHASLDIFPMLGTGPTGPL